MLGIRLLAAFSCLLILQSTNVFAIDAASTVKALRLSNTITGGLMPTSDPLFAQMVTKVQQGDIRGAADLATQSSYFATYLARRLALQMQNPALDASLSSDNDATAFLVSHFVGGGQLKPSLSTIFSENSTYMVNVTANGVTTQMHASALSAAQLAQVNWLTDLVQVSGQNAVTPTTFMPVAIPQKHVGGYLTLSSSVGDNSFAMYGATAGTNLRMIEGLWEISTGYSLLDFASTSAPTAQVPRFVPEGDPNFFHGSGQTACLACHGGGMSSLDHGYATVADIFDFDPKGGFTYNANPTVSTMKSLASDPSKRAANAACNLQNTPTAVCNPDSAGADPNQGWNLQITWASSGVLDKMGWQGPPTGAGLNALGVALGQANVVYEFMVKRIVGEICPMGSFTQSDVSSIAAAANPFASPAGSDDVRTIVSLVAANSTCQ